MITLTGSVFDSRSKLPGGGYEKIPSAKVFISDQSGFITPKKIGAVTDSEGNFRLSVPTMIVSGFPVPLLDGQYITAQVAAGNTGNKKVTEKLSSKNVYDMDISKAGLQRTIEEITVKRPKPTPKEEVKKPWKYFLIGGAILFFIGVGVTVYQKMKD